MQICLKLQRLSQGSIPVWGNQTPSMRAMDGNWDSRVRYAIIALSWSRMDLHLSSWWTLKSKSREDPLPRPAKNNKKARRSEANYYPQPNIETPESLEQERTLLLTEVTKRNNEKTIREKMARTEFRRQEIVDKKPSIENLMERWPALFQMEEV